MSTLNKQYEQLERTRGMHRDSAWGLTYIPELRITIIVDRVSEPGYGALVTVPLSGIEAAFVDAGRTNHLGDPDPRLSTGLAVAARYTYSMPGDTPEQLRMDSLVILSAETGSYHEVPVRQISYYLIHEIDRTVHFGTIIEAVRAVAA